ncbi:hypothetical protein JZ751_004401 [Albula glossodonta]|uniref:Peroxiredoxin-like 2 activated in M-CSF stimulated monocytes n=1 Tax=Albula glossodonta TaxID=121402 RepID=A0A8T2N6R5_9TELE|nr:hypothetical protein JZ751_004401 [Albula glossodonta]
MSLLYSVSNYRAWLLASRQAGCRARTFKSAPALQLFPNAASYVHQNTADRSKAKQFPEEKQPPVGKEVKDPLLSSVKSCGPGEARTVGLVKQMVHDGRRWKISSEGLLIPRPGASPMLSFGLEGELLGMGMWSLGLGAVGAALAGIFLANTDFCLTKAEQANLEYLEDADLKTIGDEERTFKAKTLWEKSGAVLMAVRRPG